VLLSVVLSAAAEEDCADSVVFAVVVDAVVVVGLGFSGGKIGGHAIGTSFPCVNLDTNDPTYPCLIVAESNMALSIYAMKYGNEILILQLTQNYNEFVTLYQISILLQPFLFLPSSLYNFRCEASIDHFYFPW